MRIFIYYFSVLLFLGQQMPLIAQTSVSNSTSFREESEKFILQLKNSSIDSSIAYPIARNLSVELNRLYVSINAEASLSAIEKEKALRSAVYFMNEYGRNLAKQKLEIYEIPSAWESYKAVLAALIHQKPFTPLMNSLNWHRSQILTASFSQYKEYPLMEDISVYKRVSSAPEFIVQFLENKPGFRYADSLLIKAAAHDPEKMIYYLNKNNPALTGKIANSKNIYLQQLATLSGDKNVTELLPFVIQLAENRITTTEILEKRTDVVKYFQLLVNTLIESNQSKDSSSIFLAGLKDGIKKKSLSFYVNTINDQHNDADAVRFSSVKGLRPEDLYYIITSTGDELYTSSYLGLYKRLMENFKEKPADSLFELVKYDEFETFLRLAANYNVLDDFLNTLSREKVQTMLHRFISGLDLDPDTGLERAMDIADLFSGLDTAPEVLEMAKKELQLNLNRSIASHHYLGIRLYKILLQVITLVKPENASANLRSMLGDYEKLKLNALENTNGEIVQLVLFYGDEDGIASFNSFSSLYNDTTKWQMTKNDNWVSIRSKSDEAINIFANRPLDMKEEKDLRAQDSLILFLESQSLRPSILIHRGHSYHLDKTLKRIQPSVKLAILGSCGGYNKAISIASMNADVQVIGSKKTGSKSINDPIIQVINETLLNKNDLLWPEIWKKLSARFAKDEATLALFNEYFPPGRNLSLFVLKLYTFYS